jgi:hypothetical protein
VFPVFIGKSKVPPVCGTLGFELQDAIINIIFLKIILYIRE